MEKTLRARSPISEKTRAKNKVRFANYYQIHKVEILEQQKEAKSNYLKTDNGKAVKNKTTYKMIALYPEKFKARYMARNAIRAGKIIKQPCEVCGNSKVEAHHDDYSKPLEVRWLCHQHHCELEGRWIARN